MSGIARILTDQNSILVTSLGILHRHNAKAGLIPRPGSSMKIGMALFSGFFLLVYGPAARAAVAFTCTVNATSMAFGTYNPLSTAGSSAVGSWTVTCNATGNGSATVAGTLTLSTGLSGRYANRTMMFGTNALNYNIYLTPAYAQIVGDGSAGTYAPSDSGTVTAGQVYQVTGNFYGYMPPSQDVPAGPYADSIVVTVTY